MEFLCEIKSDLKIIVGFVIRHPEPVAGSSSYTFSSIGKRPLIKIINKNTLEGEINKINLKLNVLKIQMVELDFLGRKNFAFRITPYQTLKPEEKAIPCKEFIDFSVLKKRLFFVLHKGTEAEYQGIELDDASVASFLTHWERATQELGVAGDWGKLRSAYEEAKVVQKVNTSAVAIDSAPSTPQNHFESKYPFYLRQDISEIVRCEVLHGRKIGYMARINNIKVLLYFFLLILYFCVLLFPHTEYFRFHKDKIILYRWGLVYFMVFFFAFRYAKRFGSKILSQFDAFDHIHSEVNKGLNILDLRIQMRANCESKLSAELFFDIVPWTSMPPRYSSSDGKPIPPFHIKYSLFVSWSYSGNKISDALHRFLKAQGRSMEQFSDQDAMPFLEFWRSENPNPSTELQWVRLRDAVRE